MFMVCMYLNIFTVLLSLLVRSSSQGQIVPFGESLRLSGEEGERRQADKERRKEGDRRQAEMRGCILPDES